MKCAAPALFLLHPDVRFCARVQQAARTTFDIQDVPSWQALTRCLRAASPVSLAVVDPYADRGSGDGPAPQLKALLDDGPPATFVAAVEARPDCFSDLRTLGEWGVAAVVGTDTHDVLAVQRVIESLRGRPLRRLLEGLLPGWITMRGRAILDAAVDVAAEGGQPRDLARRLHAAPRTLTRWCDAERLPTPRQLLLWIRVLLAAELLEHPGRSVEAVALACGYASDSGLRRALSDAMGTNPLALRRNGAFSTAAAGFSALLSGEPHAHGSGGGAPTAAADAA